MAGRMKIVDYRVTPIAFGDPPLRAASGLHAPYALRTIVEVVSDDGITGVSETHGGARWWTICRRWAIW